MSKKKTPAIIQIERKRMASENCGNWELNFSLIHNAAAPDRTVEQSGRTMKWKKENEKLAP